MTRFLLWCLFFPFLLACNGRAQEPAASPAASVPAPAYRAWTEFKSSRYPVILYRAAETDPKKNAAAESEARGALFRIEEIWAQFEAEHPGFTITVDQPIEVPAAWNAGQKFGALAKADPHICPIAGGDDPNAAWADAWNVLDSALRVTTRHALPDWFHEMLVAQSDNITLETGVGTLPMMNPNRFFKMNDAGHFSDLKAIAKQGWSNDPPTSFDEMRAQLWEYWSMRMYVDYAREAAAGSGLRDAITGVLLAAQKDGTDAGLKRLLADDHWTPQVEAYWQSVIPDAYVLAHHLQASAQLWTALAAFADRAGTHYASFGDLVTAVEADKLPLPPEVPREFIHKAHMFRDHDSGYRLTWDGKTAVMREVAPEKICFEVRASVSQDGVLHETVRKEPASGEDLALLPPEKDNPTHCDHFAIFTDTAPAHLASIVLQADRYEEQCASELPWAPRAKPSRLVMYYYGDAWKSGLFYRNFYLPDTGVTFVAPVGDETMRHEITHQIVDFSIKGEFPLWFNEGIAEYYGSHVHYAGDGFIPYRDPYEIQSIQHFLQGKWPGQWGKVTIPSLIHMNYGRWTSLKHGPYSLAWSLVYFLEHGEKDAHRGLVEDYMKTVAAGQQGAEARDEKFEAAVLALEPGWRKYWAAMPANPDAIVDIQTRARILVLLTRQAEAQNLPVKNAGSIVAILQKNQLKAPADREEWVTPTEMATVARWYNWWADKWELTDGAEGPAWTCTLKDGTVVKAWFKPENGVAHTASTVTLPSGTLLASADEVSAAGEAVGAAPAGANSASQTGGGGSYPPMPSVHDGNHPPMKPMPPVPSVHDGNHPPMPAMPAMPAVSPGATPPDGSL